MCPRNPNVPKCNFFWVGFTQFNFIYFSYLSMLSEIGFWRPLVDPSCGDEIDIKNGTHNYFSTKITQLIGMSCDTGVYQKVHLVSHVWAKTLPSTVEVWVEGLPCHRFHHLPIPMAQILDKYSLRFKIKFMFQKIHGLKVIFRTFSTKF